jgi:hypothetical protein
MTASSREAQAEIRNTTAKSETAYAAKRGIIGTNLTSDTPDASRTVSSRCCERPAFEKINRTEGHVSLFHSFANAFLKNRSKTIWVP